MYRFLDHPSEALVQVNAATLERVYEEAAIALFELMTDTSSVAPELEFEMELEAPEKDLLLIDWLNRLILLHETKSVFLSRFHVQITENDSWTLLAKVYGEHIVPGHERRLHVKSATYGQLEWTTTEMENEVRFLLDV